MDARDFVRKAIYDGAIKAGCSIEAATHAADVGLDMHNKNKFKKPIDLIEDMIKKAKAGNVKK